MIRQLEKKQYVPHPEFYVYSQFDSHLAYGQ